MVQGAERPRAESGSLVADSMAVFWKDVREGLRSGGTGRGGRWTLLFVFGYFGVFLPLIATPSRTHGLPPELATGRIIAGLPTVLGLLLIAFIFPNTIVCDAIAGERERHTLETLLATRLPDRAILLGKLLAGIAIGMGLSVVCLVLSTVTMLVVHPDLGLPLPPAWLGGFLLLGLELAVFEAALASIVSIYARSLRQAQQLTSMFFVVLFVVPFIGLQVMPAGWRQSVVSWLSGLHPLQAALVGAAVVLAMDVALLAVSFALFQRERLLRS